MRFAATIAGLFTFTMFLVAGTIPEPSPSGAGPRPSVRLAAIDPGMFTVAVDETPPAVIPDPEPEPVPAEVPPALSPRPAAAPASSGCDGEGWVIPAGIVWRESRCDYGAVNVSGCGGNGCLGAYQFDARHFTGWANGTAACGDLDWTVPADQHECARRLSADGTNLAPWGG